VISIFDVFHFITRLHKSGYRYCAE